MNNIKIGMIFSIVILFVFVPTDVFADQIPQWVKTNAELWASNEINNNEFLAGMEHLIEIGQIDIKSKNSCEKDLENLSTNKKEIKQVCNNFELNENSELIPFDLKIDYNTEGFRGNDFPIKKMQEEFRVIVVGGSTVFGAESSSEQTTIPGILEQMINYNNPDLKIRVINAGIQGATTFTELELIKNKLIEYEPDLIIVYDGWNDILADYSYWEIERNWNEMCQLSQENNFELMIFLQPIAGFGDKVLTEQEKINSLIGKDHNGFQLIQVKPFYDYLSKKLLLNENCYTSDIRSAFDDVSGPIYWDQGHISDTGNFIIADKFLENLNKKYPMIFDYDRKFIKIISKYNHPVINELIFSELNIKINYSQINFQNTLNFEDRGKGDYFQLKNKLGIENILVGKDLTHIDLKKINLNGKDLTGANLSGQDLRNIDLTNTIIRNSNLSHTNLEGKNFAGMDIRGIDFSYANLKNSNFKDSIISKIVQFPSFVPKECQDEWVTVDRDRFDNKIYKKILENMCIHKILENNVIETDFSNADLNNAKFESQNLVFVNFSNADLTHAVFNKTNFAGCSFDSAILDQVEFSQVELSYNNFEYVEMRNFEINNSWLQNISFKNSNMQEGSINGSFFFNVDFKNADLNKTKIDSNIHSVQVSHFESVNLKCKNNLICIK